MRRRRFSNPAVLTSDVCQPRRMASAVAAILAVGLLLFAATVGRRAAIRTQQRRDDLLAVLVGRRVRLGIGQPRASIFDLDANIGRVRDGRLFLFNPSELRVNGRATRFGPTWLRLDEGIPLDRIYWLEADGDRTTF
jgi:hypothetical protein